MANMHQLLKAMIEKGASDLHITAGSRPFCRLHGKLVFFEDPPLTPDLAKAMVLGFLEEYQQEVYLEHQDLDLSWQHPQLGRFRGNALVQFRGPSIILRIIPNRVPTLAELGMPEDLANLTEWTQGLVLVTGPAGCGKSTTAAALINVINEARLELP